VWVILGAGVAAAALAVVFTGCGSNPDYPPNLPFPSRADRLVLKAPEQQPTRLIEPGKLDAELTGLDAVGGKTADPADLPAAARTALDRYLKDTFATPGAPTVAGDADVSAAAEHLGLAPDRLAEGGKHFRKQCQQCHGLPGDGRGPTGLWIYPFPRDFRRGVFKFVSTGEGNKPRHADLVRTITEGLKGTAMPAFGLLPDDQREMLARYVMYLSLRGQVEYQTLAAVALGDARATGDPAAFAAAKLKEALAEWERAQAAPQAASAPDDGDPGSETHAAAVRRGYLLFTTKDKDACITCHGEFGRKPQLRYDVWGTVAKPANFTEPGLKGGSRPEDVYQRIRGGIPAVGMPAHPKLSERVVWDLVRFVRSAPYPRELPPDVRAAVYPNP
jgi:mono/diheme cytochrome c family protein